MLSFETGRIKKVLCFDIIEKLYAVAELPLSLTINLRLWLLLTSISQSFVFQQNNC